MFEHEKISYWFTDVKSNKYWYKEYDDDDFYPFVDEYENRYKECTPFYINMNSQFLVQKENI